MPAAPRRSRPRFKTRDVRLSARLRAKPEAVYRALTSARELTRWWLLGAETDARGGGRVRMVWPRLRGRDGLKGFGEREGFFVDLEPGRKVAWLWRPVRGEQGVPPLASVFLLPKGRGCEVTLVHAGFPADPAADGAYRSCAWAWEDGLAKLKLYLETGRTCRAEALDMEAARLLTREQA
ncbi:MAG: SRPBCC domain-containing protein [Elusimicrobia bacterium]|nr:SRPBCC domain-containing protein [Elusimicrobiota bacterium]